MPSGTIKPLLLNESSIVGAATLGKLSRYAASKDRRRRLSLALMGVPLWRTPLSASIAHPQRLCDYGVYTPTVSSAYQECLN